jgi:hypothetical protein
VLYSYARKVVSGIPYYMYDLRKEVGVVTVAYDLGKVGDTGGSGKMVP